MKVFRLKHGARATFSNAFILGGLALVTSAGAETQLPETWGKASKLLVSEALADFETVPLDSDSEQREATFGTAMMLLNIQPKTEGNIQRSADLFTEVASSGNDDLSAMAGYYLARIEQVHRYEPDLAKARERFTELIEAHPAHPLAQVAVVRRALIDIYDQSSLEEKRTRLAALEAQAETLSFPPARRDLHFVVADGYAYVLRDNERALANLVAADEVGIARAKSRADVWVRIAELARKTGETELARKYYQLFLTTYQRDDRHYMVAERLENLDPNPAP